MTRFLEQNPLSQVYDAEDDNPESEESIESAQENAKFGKPGSIVSKVFFFKTDTRFHAINEDGEYMDRVDVLFYFIEYDSRLDISSLSRGQKAY